ncbi:hypothetical protein FNYG_06092 [Fusarium nygamai]|uniref:Uncharacterized protein n=1 Tax=Gibberella nygamai TaxID=42673 RepID=A0A2K0WDY4_GIBNY|nr:hypothetical protein FNYG_06092 [Fusarium nygamai]
MPVGDPDKCQHRAVRRLCYLHLVRWRAVRDNPTCTPSSGSGSRALPRLNFNDVPLPLALPGSDGSRPGSGQVASGMELLSSTLTEMREDYRANREAIAQQNAAFQQALVSISQVASCLFLK